MNAVRLSLSSVRDDDIRIQVAAIEQRHLIGTDNVDVGQQLRNESWVLFFYILDELDFWG